MLKRDGLADLSEAYEVRDRSGFIPPSKSSFSLSKLAPTAELSLDVARPPTNRSTPDG
jgi:hypothetical protein